MQSPGIVCLRFICLPSHTNDVKTNGTFCCPAKCSAFRPEKGSTSGPPNRDTLAIGHMCRTATSAWLVRLSSRHVGLSPCFLPYYQTITTLAESRRVLTDSGGYSWYTQCLSKNSSESSSITEVVGNILHRNSRDFILSILSTVFRNSLKSSLSIHAMSQVSLNENEGISRNLNIAISIESSHLNCVHFPVLTNIKRLAGLN